MSRVLTAKQRFQVSGLLSRLIGSKHPKLPMQPAELVAAIEKETGITCSVANIKGICEMADIAIGEVMAQAPTKSLMANLHNRLTTALGDIAKLTRRIEALEDAATKASR